MSKRYWSRLEGMRLSSMASVSFTDMVHLEKVPGITSVRGHGSVYLERVPRDGFAVDFSRRRKIFVKENIVK